MSINYYILDVGMQANSFLGNLKYSYKAAARIKKNDRVLLRQTGKSAKDRKFRFIGHAVVAKVSNEEEKISIQLSNIKLFVEPIKQGDDFVENLHWVFKKKNKSWYNFFSQQGVTKITLMDYLSLYRREVAIPVSSNEVTDKLELSEGGKSDITDTIQKVKGMIEIDNLILKEMEADCYGKSEKELLENLHTKV